MDGHVRELGVAREMGEANWMGVSERWEWPKIGRDYMMGVVRGN